jgi:hypothetical protein
LRAILFKQWLDKQNHGERQHEDEKQTALLPGLLLRILKVRQI